MPACVKQIQKIYCSFHLLEIVIKNIANMHRKHDVQAFSKHRQKHRRAMFLSEHRLNIPSLRNGKHPIVKNIPSLRNVKIPQPYLSAVIYMYHSYEPSHPIHISERLIASICHYFPMNVSKTQNMKRKNTKGKINPKVCCFCFQSTAKMMVNDN